MGVQIKLVYKDIKREVIDMIVGTLEEVKKLDKEKTRVVMILVKLHKI